ncbi:antigen presentation protein SpaN [Salmonella enterica subsp. enterica]|uniref:Antigen presentation protein SpaN n=1 Tax=Salmonella enterica I TaxID=59201 RepID=A0A379W500_SALET|nr:antigen presentation protein SpaN [Salmonella enterica subsp. enterica]
MPLAAQSKPMMTIFPTADGVKGEDSSLTYRFQRWEMTIPSIFRRGKQGSFR